MSIAKKFLFFGLCSAAPLSAQGPVAHWSFDSTASGIAYDVSGHGHDLIAIQKKSALPLIEGVRGKALAFTDTGHFIQVAESRNAFNFPRLTLEGVIFHVPSQAPHSQVLFANTTFRPGVAEGYHFHILNSGVLGFNTGRSNTLPRWNILQSPSPLAVNRAYHVAVVMNRDGLNHLYIDGQPVNSIPFVQNDPSNDVARFGHAYGDFVYSGWNRSPVDEFKVYDRALSDAEILAGYLQHRAAIDSLNAARP